MFPQTLFFLKYSIILCMSLWRCEDGLILFILNLCVQAGIVFSYRESILCEQIIIWQYSNLSILSICKHLCANVFLHVSESFIFLWENSLDDEVAWI